MGFSLPGEEEDQPCLIFVMEGGPHPSRLAHKGEAAVVLY